MKRLKKNAILWVKRILFLLALVAIWEGLVQLAFWPSWIFPSPLAVAEKLVDGLRTGMVGEAVLVTGKRLLLGFAISLVIGSLIGFLTAKNRLVRDTFGFVMLGLQTLPSICWLPLALLWFGLSEKAIIFVVVMGSVLSMSLAVEAAVRNIPPIILRAGNMLNARGWRLYRYVLFPAILPAFISGVKQSWSFAWRSLMAGEMIFITAGLGQLLMFGRELNDMAQVMAVMVIIVSIGIVIDKGVFGVLERSFRRKWGLA